MHGTLYSMTGEETGEEMVCVCVCVRESEQAVAGVYAYIRSQANQPANERQTCACIIGARLGCIRHVQVLVSGRSRADIIGLQDPLQTTAMMVGSLAKAARRGSMLGRNRVAQIHHHVAR